MCACSAVASKRLTVKIYGHFFGIKKSVYVLGLLIMIFNRALVISMQPVSVVEEISDIAMKTTFLWHILQSFIQYMFFYYIYWYKAKPLEN